MLNKQNQQNQNQNKGGLMFQGILSDLSKYVSIGMVGMVVGTILYNNNPNMLASAENLRGSIGYLGLILVFTPLLDKVITPKSMLFTLFTSTGIGGILLAWSLAIQITLAF